MLYEQVIQFIKSLIDKGSLGPGEKAPSIRKLSKQLGVSMATVVQSYRILEDEAMLEARERSGYIVLPPRSFAISQPGKTQPSLKSKRISVNELVVLTAEVANDPGIMPLGAATLHPELMPIKDLKQITAATVRQADEWGFFYDFVPGNEALLRQLSRQSQKWGCTLAESDFVITSGAMEALQLALRIVAKPGDTIAVESPTFYPILQSLENLGMYALEIPTDPQTGIDLDIFQSMLDKESVKACILIPNFNNPLGYLMPENHKKRLVDLLSEKEIPLIEDDIYAELYFGPHRPKPLKAYDKEGLVILCGSVSKTLCSGYRVGWIAPGRYLEDIKRLKYFTNVSTPTLSQMALAECLKTNLYDRQTTRLRGIFKNQMPLYLEMIATHFPADTKVTCPQGGFLFWLELATGFDSMKLYQIALEQGISIAPGPMFSANRDYRNCFRLSGGHLWSSRTEQALVTLGQLAHQCF